MKISTIQLRKIIKEEVQKIIIESNGVNISYDEAIEYIKKMFPDAYVYADDYKEIRVETNAYLHPDDMIRDSEPVYSDDE